MKINTSRFGELEMDKNLTVHFPNGLLGFPDKKDYMIIKHNPKSPLYWLQSTTTPELAFVVTDPFLIKKDYLDGLSSHEKGFFAGTDKGETIVLVLVTVPQGQADKSTVNLQGPLLINAESQNGEQIILTDSAYNHRHPLCS